MMNKYISAREAADKWGISRRRVSLLCSQGRIKNACIVGGAWLIPDDAEKPEDPRGSALSKSEILSYELMDIIGSTHILTPQDDYDRVLSEISDERLGIILEGTLAYLRGDFEHTIRCYHKAESDEATKLCACPLTIAAAISIGDYSLYAQIENYLNHILSLEVSDGVKAWAELALNTAPASALSPVFITDWIKKGNFKSLQIQARLLAIYMRVKYFQSLGNYESMLIAAQTALNLCDSEQGIFFSSIYYNVACAIACSYLKRKDEAQRFLNDALDIALPHGFITPFAKSAAALGGLLELCLEQRFPEHYNAVISQWKRTFANWVTFHNEFTKNNITHILSLRDYQIALFVAQKIPYAKIAEQFNISVGRLNNIIQDIYNTLFVHSRDELAKFILPKK